MATSKGSNAYYKDQARQLIEGGRRGGMGAKGWEKTAKSAKTEKQRARANSMATSKRTLAKEWLSKITK